MKLTYREMIQRAKRHGWKVTGVIRIESILYTTLHHTQSRITIAIHPETLQMFKVYYSL